MGLVETCPNIKLNVNVQLNICTREQNYSLIMKCIIVYIFIIVGRKWLLYFTFTLEIPPDHVPVMGCYAEVTIVLSNH